MLRYIVDYLGSLASVSGRVIVVAADERDVATAAVVSRKAPVIVAERWVGPEKGRRRALITTSSFAAFCY